MARETQVYNRSLSGSVGAGLGSVFNASGRRYYLLEHKVSSKYHKAGESQQIIVDQIEIGRDSKCQVRFDETFETVSRRHAAIVKDGDNWKIIQLSGTNSTLLNGLAVKDSWYLQNGDEIQFSVNGPKLGFIVPQGEKSFVKSIGLSRRMSLFRKQALLPYKRAIYAISIVLLLVAVGLSAWIWQQHGVIGDQGRAIISQDSVITKQGGVLVSQDSVITMQGGVLASQDSLIKKQGYMIDSLQTEAAEHLKAIKNLKSSVSSVKTAMDKEAKLLESKYKEAQSSGAGMVESNIVENTNDISKLSSSVYFIYTEKVEITYNGETKVIENYGLAGTGFLLDDGRFVTARHCVEPWYFPSSKDDLFINAISIMGGRVTAHLVALSNDGTQFSFTNHDIVCDRKNFVRHSVTLENGESVEYAELPMSSDWAYVKTGKQGGLKYDESLSLNIQQGEAVYVLGYPYALGVGDVKEQHQIQPSYSESKAARNGITSTGLIQLSNKGFEEGNSGGPVMVKQNGEYVVVAIVSHGRESIGLVVPICLVK